MAAVCYRHLDTSRETEESTKAPNVPSRADAHDKQLGGAAEALPRALQKSSWGGVAVTDKQLGGGGARRGTAASPSEVQLGRDGSDRDF